METTGEQRDRLKRISRQRFSITVIGMLVLCSLHAQAQDYFPTPIPSSGINVRVQEFVRVPDSARGQPARLNLLTRDSTGRLFVNDQRGPLYGIDTQSGSVTPYLDLRDYPELDILSTSEAGFQSFAFHPNFAQEDTDGYGHFYTIHSSSNTVGPTDFSSGTSTSFHTRLLEWRTADPAAPSFVAADPNNAYRSVLTLNQPFGNHNAGLIAFDPTLSPTDTGYGQLYVAIGDAGSGGDPLENGQNAGNPYGAILRIDPLGSNDVKGQYGIVADNALAADGDLNTLGEIYAFGLRNPQRFGWDVATGDMYIADIGQGDVEEIDRGANGANFGWDDREGSFAFESTDTTGLTDPVAEYDHTNLVENPPTGISNRAVTLGEVYRGDGIPELDGKLLIGDFPTGLVFLLDVDDDALDGGQDGLSMLELIDEELNAVTLLELINLERTSLGLSPTTRTDLRFGFNTPGEIYVLNKHDGVIRQLTAVPIPAAGLMFLTIVPLVAVLRRRKASHNQALAPTNKGKDPAEGDAVRCERPLYGDESGREKKSLSVNFAD